MRRRAIIFVMTLGFDFNRRGRNLDNRWVFILANTICLFSSYMPPTFPDLGMTSMNELLLVRIFGTENLVRMKALLQQLMSQYVLPQTWFPLFFAYIFNIGFTDNSSNIHQRFPKLEDFQLTWIILLLFVDFPIKE